MAEEQSVRAPKHTGADPRATEHGSAAASRVGLGDGCFLACRFDGPEGAPVLMLSNSLGTHMEMWAPQLATFARHFRVLRYDPKAAPDTSFGRTTCAPRSPRRFASFSCRSC